MHIDQDNAFDSAIMASSAIDLCMRRVFDTILSAEIDSKLPHFVCHTESAFAREVASLAKVQHDFNATAESRSEEPVSCGDK